MTEAEGFVAHLGRILKSKPSLANPDHTTVKCSVGSIITLCQSFYRQGHQDGKADLSVFEQMFGKQK